MKIAIVIPVYRKPTECEIISLRQCCKVLSRYNHYIVAPDSLDTTPFHSIWSEYGLTLSEERFAPEFFVGLQGYNRLCLSREYYSRFSMGGYSHMIIHQPDVFIFEDKVEEWCVKGYEYVGAPNVGLARQKTYSPKMPLRVGNGGFSLRYIPAFLRFFDGQKQVFNLRHILVTPMVWRRNYWWLVAKALIFCIKGSMPNDVLTQWQTNEDDFWGGLLSLSEYALNKPLPEEALYFGFDRFPKELYERIGKLPMGCHAWHKYEYDEFWKKIINKYAHLDK